MDTQGQVSEPCDATYNCHHVILSFLVFVVLCHQLCSPQYTLSFHISYSFRAYLGNQQSFCRHVEQLTVHQLEGNLVAAAQLADFCSLLSCLYKVHKCSSFIIKMHLC